MVKQSKRSLKNLINRWRKRRLAKIKITSHINLKKNTKRGFSDPSSLVDEPKFNEIQDKTLKMNKDVSNGIKNKKTPKKKKNYDNEFLTAKEIDGDYSQKTMTAKRQLTIKNIFSGLIPKSALFFANIKKTSGSVVFKFIVYMKRAVRKTNKRVYIIAGAGLLLVAVLLTAVLVSWEGKAPEENQSAEMIAEVKAESTESIPVLAELQQEADAVDEVEAIVTTVPTTPPDEPVETKVSEPTQEPTTVPTTKPDPTPIPVVMNDLIEDFVVEADTYYNDMGYSSNYYEYTKDELYMLAQIIQIESGGQSYEGKLAVGNVVMNRVLCRGYPGSTITAVITAPGQFAYERHKDRTPKSSAKAAARDILDNQHWVIAQNVYFFRSGSGDGDWGSHPFYKKIGGHRFYTHRYSGRNRNGQVPPSLFDRTYKWPRYGCKPESRVKRIQYMLHKLGYDVSADKYFGKDTEIALKEFQADKSLEADGVAGPSTIEALIKAYGLEDYYLDFYN